MEAWVYKAIIDCPCGCRVRSLPESDISFEVLKVCPKHTKVLVESELEHLSFSPVTTRLSEYK